MQSTGACATHPSPAPSGIWLLVAILAFGILPLSAQSPPATFTQTISTASQSLTVDFSLHPIRSSNFEVLVQQPDGNYITHTPDVARTYLGTVQGLPGAIACGLLHADGTLWARISLEDGKTWTTTGGIASVGGSDFTPAWPTSVISAGGAGSTVYAAEVGIDSTFNHFTACGGTPAAGARAMRVQRDVHQHGLSAGRRHSAPHRQAHR